MDSSKNLADINKVLNVYKSPINAIWDINSDIVLQRDDKSDYDFCLSKCKILNITEQLVDSNVLSIKFICGEIPLSKYLSDNVLKVLTENRIITSIYTSASIINKEDICKIQYNNLLLEIPLYGANEDTHDSFIHKKGAFASTINTIHLLDKINCNIKLIFSINSKNHKEVGDIIDIAAKISCIKSVEVFINNINIFYSSCCMPVLSLSDRQVFMEIFTKKKKQYSNVLDCHICDNLVLLRNKLNSEEPNDSIYIVGNGDVLINRYFPIVFGNLRNTSIKDMWNQGLNSNWGDPKIKKSVLSLKEGMQNNEILFDQTLIYS